MVNDEVHTVGTAVLLAAAPAGRGRAVDAASVLPALAAVPPSALTGTPMATVVELADPLDPQTVLTRLRAAAAAPGPLAVYLAGQVQLDRRQHLPHLALARSTATTLRYTGLPWHWLAAELAVRRAGTTTVVADLVADAELWQRLGSAPGLLSLGPGPLLYGRIAPAPRRGEPATPEYLRHFATVWRTGARPPLPHLHAEAATQAGPPDALLLTPGSVLPDNPPPPAAGWIPSATQGPQAGTATAPAESPPWEVGSGRRHVPAGAPAPAPGAVHVHGPPTSEVPAAGGAGVASPGVPVGASARVPEAVHGPPTAEAPVPGGAGVAFAGEVVDAHPRVSVGAPARPPEAVRRQPAGAGRSPVPAGNVHVPGQHHDPHPAILAAAQAGRHGEAVAVAVAWEQDALRRYGARSQEAVHWMEVRADLARLAGEPARSCELWIGAAQARLGLRQGPHDPDVEGAVDRAHHQWEQIEDPARARELGTALVALRERVPGRKAGALAALRRRMP
ncbi:hypothetical protein [Streptomyces vilmorinianum]|uniref:hypothetical protein n=1 Tax=Streptomyces vilmorinianum TaxID=3051092 RepID=UPI0010FAE754|nr:hypothetical protein [Streptomyces vilmorinianum]